LPPPFAKPLVKSAADLRPEGVVGMKVKTSLDALLCREVLADRVADLVRAERRAEDVLALQDGLQSTVSRVSALAAGVRLDEDHLAESMALRTA